MSYIFSISLPLYSRAADCGFVYHVDSTHLPKNSHNVTDALCQMSDIQLLFLQVFFSISYLKLSILCVPSLIYFYFIILCV